MIRALVLYGPALELARGITIAADGEPSKTGRYLWAAYHGTPIRALQGAVPDDDLLAGTYPAIQAFENMATLIAEVIDAHPSGWLSLVAGHCHCVEHPPTIRASTTAASSGPVDVVYRIDDPAACIEVYRPSDHRYVFFASIALHGPEPKWHHLDRALQPKG